jgi:uncharacterized membrane protein
MLMDSNRKLITDITIGAIFAGIYVALTSLNPIGYGAIQFRFSEILLLFPFWHKKFIIPSVIAVGIANIFSPYGLLDVAVGVGIAIISYTLIIKFKNKFVNIGLYSLLCGLLVGLELTYIEKTPFWFNFLSITASQLAIGLIGIYIINYLYNIAIIKTNWFE